MAAADVGDLRAAPRSFASTPSSAGIHVGDQVGVVAGPEEALGAAEQAGVVLVPAEPVAAPEGLGDLVGSSRTSSAITSKPPGRKAGLSSSANAERLLGRERVACRSPGRSRRSRRRPARSATRGRSAPCVPVAARRARPASAARRRPSPCTGRAGRRGPPGRRTRMAPMSPNSPADQRVELGRIRRRENRGRMDEEGVAVAMSVSFAGGGRGRRARPPTGQRPPGTRAERWSGNSSGRRYTARTAVFNET